LINSVGPVQRARESYRCLFIPYVTANDVAGLYADNRYNPRYEEVFALAMSRVHYSVVMSDVDIYNDKHSHWWTLHVTTQERDNDGNRSTKNVYSPISFNDVDHSVTMAAVCLVDTLYNFPGPCHTAVIGPFASQLNPAGIDDIPAPFNDDLHANVSPPVALISFRRGPNLTNAAASYFGELQNDNTIAGLVAPRLAQASDRVNQYRAAMEQHADARETAASQAAQQASQSGSQLALTGPGAAPAQRTSPPRVRRPPPAPTIPGLNDPCGNANYRMYEATVLYFDHKFFNNFAVSRTEHIVTKANRP
jgi:hypothetical protein